MEEEKRLTRDELILYKHSSLCLISHHHVCVCVEMWERVETALMHIKKDVSRQTFMLINVPPPMTSGLNPSVLCHFHDGLNLRWNQDDCVLLQITRDISV